MKLRNRFITCVFLLIFGACEKNDSDLLGKIDMPKGVNVHYADSEKKYIDYVEIEIGRVETLVKFDSIGKVILFSSIIKDGEYEKGDGNYNIRFRRNHDGKFVPYSDPRTILTGLEDISKESLFNEEKKETRTQH